MRYIITLFIFFCLFLPLRSQDTLSPVVNSSFQGKHFFVGFMQNENSLVDDINLLVLYIAPTAKAKININVPMAYNYTFNIDEDSVLALVMPEDIEDRETELLQNLGIEINSDVPITVYSFNTQYTTTESYSAIPVEKWGTEYVVMSYPNDQYQIPEGDLADSLERLTPRSGEFMAMAAYDSTIIEFQPRAVTYLGKQTYKNYTIRLNKGDCYLVKSMKSQKGTSDLTGTIVRANKPFGLLSGHVRTAVPQNLPNDWDSKNHLVEMLCPTSAWGRHYVSVPFQDFKYGDLFRITCIDSNTRLTCQTAHLTQDFTLKNPGDFVTVPGINEPAEWMSDKPVQVAQFAMHAGTDGENEFDPCMVMLPSTEQFVNRILFDVPDYSFLLKNQFDHHYISLVTTEDAVYNLKLDGADVYLLGKLGKLDTQTIFGTNLHWVRLELTPGKHELVTDKGSFSGIMYGFGYKDAYAMTLGSSLSNPYKNDDIPPKIEYTVKCGIIDGTVIEYKDVVNTGIDYVRVLKDSTYNYDTVISPVTDSTSIVTFHAAPVDPMKDGALVFEARDKNGNGTRFRYYYKGIKVTAPDNITFTDIDYKDSTCYAFHINNIGNDTVYVDSAYFSDPRRLKFSLDQDLPYALPPKSELNATVCFAPRSDTTTLSSDFIIKFDCDRLVKIPITGSVQSLALLTSDYDFGDVRIGDTACADIKLVNFSNRTLNISSLDFIKYSSQFKFDTTGIFPVRLKPGDSLIIHVCFMPNSKLGYSSTIYYNNSARVDNQATVKGNGVAPDIQSVVVDWKKRRIGTTNDTLINIINKGNGYGKITFDRFEVLSGDVSAFDADILSGLQSVILKNDTLLLKQSFKPSALTQYHIKAYYKVDWKPHQPVVLELLGQGTKPALETVNIMMDTTKVYSYSDSTPVIIRSVGSEALTIDSIAYSSGDISSFGIDFSSLKNLRLDSGAVLSIPVRFKPTAIGLHQVVLEATHDALPNFQRDKSFITISGFAIDRNKPDVVMKVTGPEQTFACQDAVLDVSIQNIGDTTLSLQEISIKTSNADAAWTTAPVLPVSIEAGAVLHYSITARPNKSGTSRIDVTAHLSYTMTKTSAFEFKPVVMPIVLDPVPGLVSRPGDTVLLSIKGSIPYMINTEDALKVSLFLRQNSLRILSDQAELQIMNDNTVESVENVSLTQQSDRVIIDIPGKIIKEDKKIRWNLKIPFLSLLSNEIFSDISIIAASEMCFSSDTILTNAAIKEVCVLPMRGVKLIEDNLDASVYPNPVSSENLKIELYLPGDEQVNISLFDGLGKKYSLTENLYLKKGSHSLIFEIKGIVSGAYLLTIDDIKTTKKLLLIISK